MRDDPARDQDMIIERLMAGETLKGICRDQHMPSVRTVMTWIRSQPDFAQRYMDARAAQAEMLIDQILTEIDQVHNDMLRCTYVTPDGRELKLDGPLANALLKAARMRMDAAKWLAAKLIPQVYGDRTVRVIKATTAAKDDPDREGELMEGIWHDTPALPAG